MQRILVVANLTLGGEQLAATLTDRIAAGATAVHVVVPAAAEPSAWFKDEQAQIPHARARLDMALRRFGELGAEVTGEIGDERPVEAVGDALRAAAQPFDEVILSTLPQGPSRWLRMDVVSRVTRAITPIPVTHVVGAYEPATA